MIEVNGCNHRHDSIDRVCRVESPTQPDLQNSKPGLAVSKVAQRDRGDLFEESRRRREASLGHEIFPGRANSRSQPSEICLAYLESANPNALLNAHEMRRRKQGAPVPGGAGDRIYHCSDRTLAVGAGYNN